MKLTFRNLKLLKHDQLANQVNNLQNIYMSSELTPLSMKWVDFTYVKQNV